MKYKITTLVSFIIVVFLLILSLKVYHIVVGPDTHCSIRHATKSALPTSLVTAQDFFAAGNYYYDLGNCKKALDAYSQGIALNPNSPELYNNRAYTYMRLREYANALPDENVAITLRPDYVQALLNRADLYNYYGPVIDRQKAIADYQKVIALGAVHNNSVCGHLAMAQTNNLVPLAILKFVFNRGYCK